MADIALTAAMRTNLLTLQSTQEGIDKQQAILATGRKVNSALDNPSSFFASQSLNNRSNDLSRLLDGMGQNISTIKQADKGVASLTKLVEQADAIANQALTAASESREAKVTGDVDLSGTTDMSSIGTGLAATDKLRITYFDSSNAAQTVDVALGTNSIDQFVADINATANTDLDIEASLNDSGQLEITSSSNQKIKLSFTDTANAAKSAVADALGFREQAGSMVAQNSVNGTAESSVTALSSAKLESQTFYASGATGFAKASDDLRSVFGADGTTRLMDVDNGTEGNVTGDITLSVNGGASVTVATLTDDGTTKSATTIQGMIDNINSNASLEGIEASYDDETGKLSIRATDASVTDIQLGVTQGDDDLTNDDGTVDVNFGFGFNGSTQLNADSNTTAETFRLGGAAGELAKLESDYDAIRGQIDQLVEDTGYQGVNLLKGDDLTTVFNEDRTSSITTKGVTFNSDGLGISEANFGSSETITNAMTEVRGALTGVRQFSSSLANDLAVIQTRQDYTKETINNLKEGSDKLTLADKNEEGAKLLALQTQQQLGVISLSMASQSSQSVLRLF